MKTLAGLFLALLTVTAGCAQKDWIDRTLVTVDVTETWEGVDGFSTPTSLELEQQASTIKGFIRDSGTRIVSMAGPIEGTVAGDVLRFKNARGDVEGELTVSGDEMSGTISRAGYGGTRRISLRRVDPSSPPASPPR
jgi:hypothetical protein